MPEQSKQLAELTELIERHSSRDGVHSTVIPSLFFIRNSTITRPKYKVYEPSLCIVMQGVKESLLGKERFVYGPGDYLITSVNLPVSSQIIDASSANPYLALNLKFTPNQILEVLKDSGVKAASNGNTQRGMYVSRVESSLFDAVTRFVRLLDNPIDIKLLAPLLTKEILYRVLQGRHGVTLEQIAIDGSKTAQIRNVIEHIMSHFNQSFRIEELAEIGNMSVSSLHRHFKEVTAMSPIQFQKQLRLQEARQLLLTEATDAAEVSFRVGYESPSQFSREYSRMFGLPPIEDIKRLKEKYAQ
ncbi:AraC family transcriptional regulator N-terminal domain-containing protein [Bacillota bacterium Lsc_1132]